MKKKITDDQYKRLDFMYTVMQKKIDTANEGFNTIVSKTNFLFGFTATITALYCTLIVQNHLLKDVSICVQVVRVLPLVSLVGTLLCLIMASKLREYTDPPHEDTIYSDKAFLMQYYYLKRKVVGKMKKSYVNNNAKYKSISYWLGWTNYLLFLSVILIIVSILI